MDDDFVFMRYFEAVRMNVLYIEHFLILQTCFFTDEAESLSLRPNVHTIHSKFYVTLVIYNTI